MSRGYSIEGEKYGLSHLPTTDPTKDYGKKRMLMVVQTIKLLQVV